MKEKSIKQTINILEIPAQDSIMAIREKNLTRFINLRDVTHIKSNSYLSIVYTIEGEAFTFSKLLRQFEESLHDYGFVRVNRNSIVNLIHVERYEAGDNPVVFLRGERNLAVSRRRCRLIRSLYLF
ncbi:LytR/AlgR family response regulator transcription factor [Alistipes sp. ZOR0009]|uniref:LytR/AlgR family response regulator transcription factor n=1 Tax=Alistipes sp. ZOR0009 TaxID=1339253 RepID=UPI000645CE7F|nr:LytTR family DNA-binding domain-containing protein [Alistipes sp. ZOR0009]